MIGLAIRNIVQFIVLVLLQVLILNQVTFFDGWAQPYLYIYFIIALPFNFPNRFILPLGFITGLTIDFFTHTPGIHASATLLLAYLRPYVIKSIRPREGFESVTPSIRNMGFSKYLTYIFILVLAHHIWLFGLLYFSTHLWLVALGHAFLSTIFTLLLILPIQAFNQDRKTY